MAIFWSAAIHRRFVAARLTGVPNSDKAAMNRRTPKGAAGWAAGWFRLFRRFIVPRKTKKRSWRQSLFADRLISTEGLR
jgi:hypothetical protein